MRLQFETPGRVSGIDNNLADGIFLQGEAFLLVGSALAARRVESGWSLGTSSG